MLLGTSGTVGRSIAGTNEGVIRVAVFYHREASFIVLPRSTFDILQLVAVMLLNGLQARKLPVNRLISLCLGRTTRVSERGLGDPCSRRHVMHGATPLTRRVFDFRAKLGFLEDQSLLGHGRILVVVAFSPGVRRETRGAQSDHVFICCHP